jgi:hypothetical protein
MREKTPGRIVFLAVDDGVIAVVGEFRFKHGDGFAVQFGKRVAEADAGKRPTEEGLLLIGRSVEIDVPNDAAPD